MAVEHFIVTAEGVVPCDCESCTTQHEHAVYARAGQPREVVFRLAMDEHERLYGPSD